MFNNQSKQPQMDNKQAQHWLDQIIAKTRIYASTNQVQSWKVDDMKTPSGRIHVGSLCGVIIHDFVAKALNKQNDKPTSFTYIFNDFDAMDGLPQYLDAKIYTQQMGKPLINIPAPKLDQSGLNPKLIDDELKTKLKKAKSLAEFYAIDFIFGFNKLGCTPTVLYSSQLYQQGMFDVVIAEALDKAETIKTIYQQEAKYQLPKVWFPFQPICQQCGKMSTTTTINWNGKLVEYYCKEDKVNWTKGCGYHGFTSPFKGNGKLLWKVDWPAHWKVLGINIEGGGKDHNSAGGSRDIARKICKHVFNIPEPFNIPYEFILIKGAKMSSSKGVGASVSQLLPLLTPQVARFMFAKKHYNQVLDFDPKTMFIADLYDQYDLASQIYFNQKQGDNRLARSFELSAIESVDLEPAFLPRFRDLVIWSQYPEINLLEKLESIKGSALTQREQNIFHDRLAKARHWLQFYAPKEMRFAFVTNSKISTNLDKEKKEYLIAIIDLVLTHKQKKQPDPQELQLAIYQCIKQKVEVKLGFQLIYQFFIDRNCGPRTAWLLLSFTDDQLLLKKRQLQEKQ